MVSPYRGFLKQTLPTMFLSDHKIFYGKGKCMKSVVLMVIKCLSILNLTEIQVMIEMQLPDAVIFLHDFC